MSGEKKRDFTERGWILKNLRETKECIGIEHPSCSAAIDRAIEFIERIPVNGLD